MSYAAEAKTLDTYQNNDFRSLEYRSSTRRIHVYN